MIQFGVICSAAGITISGGGSGAGGASGGGAGSEAVVKEPTSLIASSLPSFQAVTCQKYGVE
jgi:hypothetical protein